MKQKKLLSMVGMLFLLISIILVSSCTSMRPVANSAHFPADGSKYVILGRVEFEGKLSGKGAGYKKLLEAAKAKYPKADDVVNITIDAKITDPVIAPKKMTYVIMSGVAIDYVEVK